MMNFPQCFDLVLRRAPARARMLGSPPGCRGSTPHLPTARSTPTACRFIKASTGEHVLHWLELDGRTTDPCAARSSCARRGLQPGGAISSPYASSRRRRELLPGAVRGAARHAHRPPAIEDAPMETNAFRPLTRINRADLQLAFDFTAGESADTTDVDARSGVRLAIRSTPHQTGTSRSRHHLISDGTAHGRRVEAHRGTYQSPLFLTDCRPTSVQFLNVDETHAGPERPHGSPFDISIPCSVLQVGTSRPIYLEHGIFGTGQAWCRGPESRKPGLRRTYCRPPTGSGCPTGATTPGHRSLDRGEHHGFGQR
jgi:hypothetical protein